MIGWRSSFLPLAETFRWGEPIVVQSRDFPETRPSMLAMLAEAGGEHTGWREFFNRYAPPVYRIARLRGLSPPDADDIVQQVMLSISKHLAGFRYDRDRGQFRQWVRRIAENKINTLFRRQRPAAVDPSVLDSRGRDDPTADEAWAAEWKLQDMLFCLDQVAVDISPRRMRAFLLYVLGDVSAQETAKSLGMTVGYVYVTRNQVLNMIRERMTAMDEVES